MEQNIKKRLQALMLLIAVLILFLIGWLVYRDLTFHFVGTDPATNNVASVSPYLKVNFNQPLSSSDLNIHQSPYLGRYKVDGKSIEFTINNVLSTNKTYTLDIVTVKDTGGTKLSNVVIKFKPVYVGFNDLSTNQQNTILERQDKGAQAQPPSFIGTSGLLNVGISSQQVQAYEQAVVDYASSIKTKLDDVIINQSSITTGGNGNGVFIASFSITSGNLNFNISMSYTGLESAQVTIYNTRGTQLYQEGSINSATNITSTSSVTQ